MIPSPFVPAEETKREAVTGKAPRRCKTNDNESDTMRINVYSQELTSEIELIEKAGTDDEGRPETFYGVRMYLLSPEQLHHTTEDDDRSGITFWLPKSTVRRAELMVTLHKLAMMVATTAPGDTARPEEIMRVTKP